MYSGVFGLAPSGRSHSSSFKSEFASRRSKDHGVSVSRKAQVEGNIGPSETTA
jgi:hypothetical protein